MIVAGGTLIVTCPFAGYPIDSVTWERGMYTIFKFLGDYSKIKVYFIPTVVPR